MRRIIKFFLYISIIIILQFSSSPYAHGQASLSEKDAGSTVVLKLGEIFQVVLPGNPTTGYSWEMAPGGIAVLRQIGEREFKRDSDLIGSGGKFIFTFEASAPGQMVLRLIYHRPWERNVQPAKTFEVTVEVK